MYTQATRILIDFLKAGKKIPYIYIVGFWLAIIYIQNIIKYLFLYLIKN